MKKTLFLLVIISLRIHAQEVAFDSTAFEYAQTITSEDLSSYLHVLASDEYEGRETGKKGQKMAAKYISEHFSRWGLKPVGTDSSYFQKFKLIEKSYDSISVSYDESAYKEFEDYILMSRNYEPLSIKAPVVFVGFGLDYSDIDVEGKVVAILDGYPTGYMEDADFQQLRALTQKKVFDAYEQGAVQVLVAMDFSDQFMKQMKRMKHWLKKPSLSFEGKESPQRSYIAISEPALGDILELSEKKFSKIKKKCKKESFKGSLEASEVSIKLSVKIDTLYTENVVGMIEGTDKKDEVVVLSAHYDHIGIKGGKVYNGADDDGSGTISIMEMAQAFAQARKEGNGPRRSILVIGMTGEEKGLLGSEYYSEHPIFPLEKTVADLNTDMVGRLDEDHLEDTNYVYLIGSDMLSTDLHNISEAVNKTYKNINLDYKFNELDDPNRFYYRSDHYNFAKHGIPVIFYFNGVHEDYHQHTDTVDKILFDKIENICQLIFLTAWEVANREERIVVDKDVK